MKKKGKPFEVEITKKTYSFEGCSPETIKDFIQSNVKVGDWVGIHTDHSHETDFVSFMDDSCMSVDHGISIGLGGLSCKYEGIKYIDLYTFPSGMKKKECESPILRALEEKGIRWNPETEEIEEAKEQRWRAKRGESYCYVRIPLDEIFLNEENFDETDNYLWESGNYFRTIDEAKKYADKFRRMLKERTLDKEV
ncbi:hypothetical protein [Paraprevotella xylaniphila]|uniref:hypothetical protein n=1 Tax=Paraprevotella xylaniphila TaxID=454155 RepID=UPI003AB7F43D